MTTGWTKLTPAQRVQLDALTATLQTNHELIAMPDASGDYWLSSDCLDEISGIFAHYAALLGQLSVTQLTTPTWPAP